MFVYVLNVPKYRSSKFVKKIYKYILQNKPPPISTLYPRGVKNYVKAVCVKLKRPDHILGLHFHQNGQTGIVLK